MFNIQTRQKTLQQRAFFIFFLFLPVLVNDRIEQPSVFPRSSEVVTADPYVALGHLLGPEQKPLLCRHVLGLSGNVDFRNLWKRTPNELRFHLRDVGHFHSSGTDKINDYVDFFGQREV